jgi:hypothetical protein
MARIDPNNQQAGSFAYRGGDGNWYDNPDEGHSGDYKAGYAPQQTLQADGYTQDQQNQYYAQPKEKIANTGNWNMAGQNTSATGNWANGGQSAIPNNNSFTGIMGNQNMGWRAPEKQNAIRSAFNDPNNNPQKLSTAMREWGVSNDDAMQAMGWDQNKFNSYFGSPAAQPLARTAAQNTDVQGQPAAAAPVPQPKVPASAILSAVNDPNQTPQKLSQAMREYGVSNQELMDATGWDNATFNSYFGLGDNKNHVTQGTDLDTNTIGEIANHANSTPAYGTGMSSRYTGKDGREYDVMYQDNNSGSTDGVMASRSAMSVQTPAVPGKNKAGDTFYSYDMTGKYLGSFVMPKDPTKKNFMIAASIMLAGTAATVAGLGATTSLGAATEPVASLTTGAAPGAATTTAATTAATTGAKFALPSLSQVGAGLSAVGSAAKLLTGGGGGGGGSGGSGGGGGGSFLNSLLGLGSGLVDANRQGKASDQMQNWLNTQFKKVDDLYAPGSPEYNYLKQEMERKDAAAGRNSQYGPRSVELGARIAQIKADNISRMTIGTSGAMASAINQNASKYGGLSASGANWLRSLSNEEMKKVYDYLAKGGEIPGLYNNGGGNGNGGYTAPDGTKSNNPSGYVPPSVPDNTYDPTTDPEYGGGETE